MAASQLHAAGLPELVTGDLDEYEAFALELVSKPERLDVVKAKLARAHGSAPLFDLDCFRRHIEAAYKIMWDRQQRGEPPAGFAVPES